MVKGGAGWTKKKRSAASAPPVLVLVSPAPPFSSVPANCSVLLCVITLSLPPSSPFLFCCLTVSVLLSVYLAVSAAPVRERRTFPLFTDCREHLHIPMRNPHTRTRVHTHAGSDA